MERYYIIAKNNLKFHLFPHILAACLLCLASPLVMGVENLDKFQTAKIIDVFLSLMGIILLVPLFLPDDDISIRDLIRSKKESMLFLHGIRLLEEVLLIVLLTLAYLFFLRQNNCQFHFSQYFYGALSNMIFLGGLGILFYGIFDMMPIAYMIPLVYYISCYGTGKKYLGKFFLFSMLGGEVQDKIYLFIFGILMIVVGILYRDILGKKIIKT